MRKKLLKWIALLGVFAFVAAGCGSSSSGNGPATTQAAGGATTTVGSGSTKGVSITIALGSEPTSLDPQLVDDGGERAINDNIYETLLARTPDGKLVPGLAVAMPKQINDTTWQFKLRQGVKFQNGEAFNADSVVASVKRMIRLIKAGTTDNAVFFSSLSGAVAIDESTVNITTAEPDGVFLSRMYWLKMIPASAEASEDLSKSVVGTGPYRFVSWTRGESISLAANPDYWGGEPPITNVQYKFVSESGSRFAGLLSGAYDLITNLNPADVPKAPQSVTAQGQEHPVIILNADQGITADLNVRLALNLAVDKEAIAKNLYGGFATVDAGQLLSPSILGFNPDISAYPYDPAKAAQLIKDAGVAGQTITLVGESSGRWLLDTDLLQAIAGYWEKAGLKVDLKLPEFGAYLKILFDRENRADAIFVSSGNDLLDPDRQLTAYYQAGGIGSSNSDAELSKLVDEGRSAVDDTARAAFYRKAVKLAYDKAYFVWLINTEDIYGLSKRMVWQPRVDSKLLVKEMSVR